MTEKSSGYSTEHAEHHTNKGTQSSRKNIRSQNRSPLFYVLRLLIVASV